MAYPKDEYETESTCTKPHCTWCGRVIEDRVVTDGFPTGVFSYHYCSKYHMWQHKESK